MLRTVILLVVIWSMATQEKSAASVSAKNQVSWWMPSPTLSELGPHADSARGIDFVDLGRCFSFPGSIHAAQFALRFTDSATSDHLEAGKELGIRLHIYKRQRSTRAFLLVAESGTLVARERAHLLPSGHVVVNASGEAFLPLAFETDDCLGWSYSSADAEAVIAYSGAGGPDVRWHRPALDRSDEALRQFPGVAQRRYDLSVYVSFSSLEMPQSQNAATKDSSEEIPNAAASILSSSGISLDRTMDLPGSSESLDAAGTEDTENERILNGSIASFGNMTDSQNSSTSKVLLAYKRMDKRPSRTIKVVPPDAQCMAAEHGIYWLHVRSLLLQHLGISDGRIPSEADAIAAQNAINSDEYLPMPSVASIQAGELEASCRLGCAALKLLGCITKAGTSDCGSSNTDRIIHFILGLSADGPNIDDVLLSGWPVHILLSILVRKANEGVVFEDDYSANLQKSLQSLASARLASNSDERYGSGFPSELMAAFSHVGPCMAPFSRLTCDSSRENEAHWAAASAAIALAHAQLQWNRDHAADMASSACDGNADACLNAVFDAKVSSYLDEAEDALEAPLLLPRSAAAIDRLTGTSWPFLMQLSELSAVVAPPWGIEEKTPKSYFSRSAGICGCNLVSWHAHDVHALVASLRILRRLSVIGNNVQAIIAEVRSSDAHMACPDVFMTQEENASDSGGCRRPEFVESAIAVLKAWGDTSAVADGLRDAGPSEFDAGLCVPGALAAAMVCALVALVHNCYGLATELVEVLRNHISGVAPCIAPTPAQPEKSEYHWNKHIEFRESWADLLPWVQPEEHFVTDVWEPVLISNRWWLGAETSHGRPPVQTDMTMSSSACSGIVGSGPQHHCHQGVRGAGLGVGVVRGKVELPWMRVLGVGPMKAGSTAVWQSLGAATQLPMGQDCFMSGHTDLVWRIARRQKPLWDLLEGCSEEEFKWELVKDPMLTPIAGRLAASWQALSVHGEALHLYFLVRNPFDCVRAFVAHLDLELSPPDGRQQFSLKNMPHARRFTRGKQLFLDVRRESLEYSGYIDAAVQRWVLAVDEYLSCPQRFALIRYEDFMADPVQATHLLVQQLGLSSRWSSASAERVREAANTQYQPRSSSRGSDPRTVFGPALHARIYAAVEARAFLLGYGSLLGPKPTEALTSPPIDVPTVPTEQSCHRV